MKQKSTKKQVLILLALLMAATQVGAVEGDVVYTYGEVLIHRNPSVVHAEIGMPVGQGDVIETGGDGVAVLSLLDGAEVKLRENTILSLDSLDGPGKKTTLRLAEGSVFSRVNRHMINGFAVTTETAVMGVRGTEFFVAYGRKIDNFRDVWVCVNTGSVEVAITESGDTLIVEEGKGINILSGTNLTTPQRYPWTRKLNWNMDPGAGEVADRTDLEQAYSDLLDQDYD
jgi:ferric-dicitrate binding protein FerR (iron transport regulator)